MTDKQKQFIILRAENLSFDKISNNLKISKPTVFDRTLGPLAYPRGLDVARSCTRSGRGRVEPIWELLPTEAPQKPTYNPT